MNKNTLLFAISFIFFLKNIVASDSRFFDTGRAKEAENILVQVAQENYSIAQQQQEKKSCKPISYCCGLACCLGGTYLPVCCIPGTVVIACTALSDEE